MNLTTLLEYQRCYDILRDAEGSLQRLSGKEYLDALMAKGKFDAELEEITQPINVEITT